MTKREHIIKPTIPYDWTRTYVKAHLFFWLNENIL